MISSLTQTCCCLLWLCLVVPDARSAPGPPGGDWSLLQTEQVRIQCRPTPTSTECEALANLDSSPDRLASVIVDLARWPEIFPSVRAVRELEPGLWSVDIELPFPLGRWPLIAEVIHRIDGAEHHIELIQRGSGVALWAHASWRITPEGPGSQVQYLWRSDALRRVPAPVRRMLLRRTGHNTLWGVALAVGAQPSAP
ncbi:MAG TPA: hypothetical protein ENK18_00180 [Deltaproteobacteria bacterium]|nr:hypothetical protein [Deltaproteobacteria bacterium]